MAINKEKNVNLQVTFSKDDASQLEALRTAFAKNGIKMTKSAILVQAFRTYLKVIIMAGSNKQQEDKVEEPQGEEKDA